eukprot:CAMPEP_0204616272 /NCGR_PEP_ID=MMETSP0717-20131115/3554_1 /ASSEMBLY_ACC=CAM_ASM_000666 /TAXON_ID=230516 /ORGANISM="Chaetoceros curvisetus" /LENGTH=470 /DNA_ID=CAMNT_0051629449 /DNA_START=69 /DNA_END=1481 /DNA_ORIENTATION=-
MISSIFVLSPRGDTILSKMYRTLPEVGAHERSHTVAFFRRIKFWNDMNNKEVGDGEKGKDKDGVKRDPPPVFVMPDGQSYLHVNRNGLIFGCATGKNVSPCTVIELLSRIAKVFKDYCGTLSEEAIRKNFILLYELLDEMVDYGYPQVTRTENLKAFVYNEPIVVTSVPNTGKMINPKTASANAVHKPVIGSVNAKGKSVNSNQKNEIFVDILERLNVIFNNNGYIVNSTIDGCIQMKSYLAGNPELRLALNEDLVIGKANAPSGPSYGAVVLDDVSFHDCVNLTEFENARTLSFFPPDGEFVVLNYRVTGEYRTPFRIFPAVEETGPRSFEITVMVRADMESSHFGANVAVELPLPRCTASATCSLMSSSNVGSPSAEFILADKKILWTMKKFPGGSEQTLKVKVTLEKACTSQIRREIGPVNMNFEIPMFNVSNLNVRYLRIAENMPGYSPYRWVRYVTQSYSYVCRM